MHARLLILAICCASAVRANDKVGVDAEFAAGPVWALPQHCDAGFGCPTAIGISLRAAYAVAEFASVGLLGAAVLGPEGIGSACNAGSQCAQFAGYRAASLLVDGRVHTLGGTQVFAGLALGVGRLIRLQCNCSEEYDMHGSALPVVELGLGIRTYVVPRIVHLGIEGRYSAMFGATFGGSTCCGGASATPVTLTVNSLRLALSIGASI